MSKITWRLKPKIINYIPKHKYVLFIDESGCNSRKSIENSLKSGKNGTSIRDDVYMLNGVIVYGDDHTILTRRFNQIKKKITVDGMFDYVGKGIRPINFHNVEIEGHKKPFNNLYDGFCDDINNVLSRTKFTQISAGVNYYMYSNNNDTIDFDCMLMTLGALVNKYANYLNSIDKDGIIVFETVNKIEDEKKLSYIKKILKKGTRNNSASFYSKITAVYFRPKWANVNGEWKTCAGLELADLTISSLRRLYHPEFIIVESKMYGYPNYGRDSINIIK